MGTLISFRLGQADAEVMAREFAPDVSRTELVNLPNWQAYVKTLIDGQTVRPFSMETQPDPAPPDPERARQVRAASRRRYGRPRREVEAEIARSLAGPTSTED